MRLRLGICSPTSVFLILERLLPGRKEPDPAAIHPLLDLRTDPTREPSLKPVQLLEGAEYYYILHIAPAPPDSSPGPPSNQRFSRYWPIRTGNGS